MKTHQRIRAKETCVKEHDVFHCMHAHEHPGSVLSSANH